MFRTSAPAVCAVLIAALTACDKSAGSVACGLDALTGPLAVKQSFAEGQSLTTLPDSVPAGLPIRLVAGPAWHGSIVDSAGRWHVTTHGTVSKQASVGYGVLVVDYADHPLGVFAFDGRSIVGASKFGTLAIGDTIVPLLAVRVNPAVLQHTSCPFFPDSLR
jgi:hypothetical protein